MRFDNSELARRKRRIYKRFLNDDTRRYQPYVNDYQQSRFNDFTYNYFLNAPMRGDKSENWQFPPQYYYFPKYNQNTHTYMKY